VWGFVVTCVGATLAGCFVLANFAAAAATMDASPVSVVEVHDTVSDTWSTGTPLPGPLAACACAVTKRVASAFDLELAKRDRASSNPGLS
jgi:hypothetical protein